MFPVPIILTFFYLVKLTYLFIFVILSGSYQGSSLEMNINKPAIGGPFKLYDTENHVVTDHDLRGNWTLMYFGYSSSPDVGPEEVQKMAKATDILGAVSYGILALVTKLLKWQRLWSLWLMFCQERG